MGVEPVRPLRELQDLLFTETTFEVLEWLTDDGAMIFIGEFSKALSRAKDTEDITPVNDVITSWHRSLLFLRHKGFDDRCHDMLANDDVDESMDLGEVARYLELDLAGQRPSNTG